MESGYNRRVLVGDDVGEHLVGGFGYLLVVFIEIVPESLFYLLRCVVALIFLGIIGEIRSFQLRRWAFLGAETLALRIGMGGYSLSFQGLFAE